MKIEAAIEGLEALVLRLKAIQEERIEDGQDQPEIFANDDGMGFLVDPVWGLACVPYFQSEKGAWECDKPHKQTVTGYGFVLVVAS